MMAFYIWKNPATLESILSIILVLGGSSFYTYVAMKQRESEAAARAAVQEIAEKDDLAELAVQGGESTQLTTSSPSDKHCVAPGLTAALIASIGLTIGLRALLTRRNSLVEFDIFLGDQQFPQASLPAYVQPCEESDFSIFQALHGCKDDMVGIGSDCTCNEDTECRFGHVREYLPSPEVYLQKFRQQRSNMCDRRLGNQMRTTLLQKNIEKHRAFPQDDANPGINTVGKDVRYNAIMAYAHFEPMNNESTLYDFVHPGYPWTSGTPACAGDPDLQDWNCLYKPLASLGDHDFGPAKIKASHVHAALQARTQRSHIVQVMLYGLFLDMMTVSSDPAMEYMAQNLKEIVNFPDDDSVPSVGMQVRGGDSCDVVYDHEDPELYVHYLGVHGRPCFAPQVYLKRLRQLQEMYGVKKVYLATDSEDMIAAAHEATDFNWVYLDIDRSAFSPGHGWIESTGALNRTVAVYSGVADFDLLARGDIFVGTFTSHYSKVGMYKMAGQLMDLPPFISLDYTQCCDTVDVCSAEEIDKRGFNIEQCINGAVECRREFGWVGNQDPCGIYGSPGIPL